MNAKPVLFTNANLIDGSGIPLSTEPFSVLVSGNVIETVAQQSQYTIPEGVEIIDLQGKILCRVWSIAMITWQI